MLVCHVTIGLILESLALMGASYAYWSAFPKAEECQFDLITFKNILPVFIANFLVGAIAMKFGEILLEEMALKSVRLMFLMPTAVVSLIYAVLACWSIYKRGWYISFTEE